MTPEQARHARVLAEARQARAVGLREAFHQWQRDSAVNHALYPSEVAETRPLLDALERAAWDRLGERSRLLREAYEATVLPAERAAMTSIGIAPWR